MSAYYSRNSSFSRSYNAERAEAQGRLPLTRFCARYGLLPDLARQYWGGEWHHVSKFANCVPYYDPFAFFEFDDESIIDRMQECSRPRPTDAQLANRKAAKSTWLRENWHDRPWKPGPVEVPFRPSTFIDRAEALIAKFAPGEGWRPEDFRGAHLTEEGFLAKLAELRQKRLRAKARARLARKFQDGRRIRDRHARLLEFLRLLNREWRAKAPDRVLKRIARAAPRRATLNDYLQQLAWAQYEDFEPWSDETCAQIGNARACNS